MSHHEELSIPDTLEEAIVIELVGQTLFETISERFGGFDIKSSRDDSSSDEGMRLKQKIELRRGRHEGLDVSLETRENSRKLTLFTMPSTKFEETLSLVVSISFALAGAATVGVVGIQDVGFTKMVFLFICIGAVGGGVVGVILSMIFSGLFRALLVKRDIRQRNKETTAEIHGLCVSAAREILEHAV